MYEYKISFTHDTQTPPRSYFASNVHTALMRATRDMTVRPGLVLSLKVTNAGKHTHVWVAMNSLPLDRCVDRYTGCGMTRGHKVIS